MSNVPAHAEEHRVLMQMVANEVDRSELIAGMIIITIGVDGRPMVGANIDSVEGVSAVLRMLGNTEKESIIATTVGKPTSN